GLPTASGRGDDAAPFSEARLAGVDLLTIADKGDDDGPAGSAGHDLQHMGGFGIGEDGLAALGVARGLGGVPGALGFIEDDDMFRRWVRRVADMGFEEAVHVLQESPSLPRGLATIVGFGIAHQGFAKDGDERGVAGEESSVLRLVAEDDVEAAKSFAGTWDAGDEDDQAQPVLTRMGNGVADGSGGQSQVGGVGTGGGDVLHTMAGEHQTGGIHDAGDRAIRSSEPGAAV